MTILKPKRSILNQFRRKIRRHSAAAAEWRRIFEASSSSSNRKKDNSQSIKSGSVSRGSQCGSSQMALRHENHAMSERSGLSRSRARGRSRSSNRKMDNCLSIKSRSVSRGSQCESSKMTFRHETKLRVANMPFFVHQHNREGRYTGEINDYGQPNGKGTIRYDDGTTFTMRWTNGSFEEIKAIVAPKPGKVRGRLSMGSIS